MSDTGPFHRPFQSYRSFVSGHVLLIKNRRAPTLCTFKKVKVKICIIIVIKKRTKLRTRRGWRTFEFKKLQNSQKIVSGVRHLDFVQYVRLKGRAGEKIAKLAKIVSGVRHIRYVRFKGRAGARRTFTLSPRGRIGQNLQKSHMAYPTYISQDRYV